MVNKCFSVSLYAFQTKLCSSKIHILIRFPHIATQVFGDVAFREANKKATAELSFTAYSTHKKGHAGYSEKTTCKIQEEMHHQKLTLWQLDLEPSDFRTLRKYISVTETTYS